MHNQDPAHLAGAVTAHCTALGPEPLRIVNFIALRTNPKTGVATFTSLDLVHQTNTQNVSTAHRSYRAIRNAGYITELTPPALADSREGHTLKYGTRRQVYNVAISVDCNPMCTNKTHCTDGTYKNILRLGGWTNEQFSQALNALNPQLRVLYIQLITSLAGDRKNEAFVRAYITPEELASTHRHLLELDDLGYIDLVRVARPSDPKNEYYEPRPTLPKTSKARARKGL